MLSWVVDRSGIVSFWSAVVRGPSGVGKSQLLRAVAGLVPHEGEVGLGETTRGALPPWRARVVYVPQDPPSDESTGRGWVERVATLQHQLGRPADDPVPLAEAWGLSPDRWEQPMARLSGGERQRLWLALVLSRRPDAVLLDEPSSALDPDARDAVATALEGRLGLLVTHDPVLGERLAADTLLLGAP